MLMRHVLVRYGAFAALMLLLVFLRPGPAHLGGVDAACYARVAGELAERPISDWAKITLNGGEFFEHPPMGLWLEAIAFRIGGASADTAVWLARFYALASLCLLFAIGVRLANHRTAAFCLLSYAFFPGFHYESQNPMLEAPLTLFLSMTVLGAALLSERLVAGCLLFGIGSALAFLTKGPPALAAVPVLIWMAGRGFVRWPRALAALGLAGVLSVLAAVIFEAARASKGLEPFFPRYFDRRVVGALTVTAEARGPLFIVEAVANWYLAGLLAIPITTYAWRKIAEARRLIEFGWIWTASVIAGFSIPLMQNPWYVHPVAIGMGALLGSALATIPARFDRWWAAAVLVASGVYVIGMTGFPQMSSPRPELRAISTSPRPIFHANEPRDVANCSSLGPWMAEHLFAFHWRARLRDCAQAAPFTFTSSGLRRNQ